MKKIRKIIILFCVCLAVFSVDLLSFNGIKSNSDVPTRFSNPESSGYSKIDMMIDKDIDEGDQFYIFEEHSLTDVDYDFDATGLSFDQHMLYFEYEFELYEPIDDISLLKIDIVAINLIPGTIISIYKRSGYRLLLESYEIDTLGSQNITYINTRPASMWYTFETIVVEFDCWFRGDYDALCQEYDEDYGIERSYTCLNQIAVSIQEETNPIITPVNPSVNDTFGDTVPEFGISVEEQFLNYSDVIACINNEDFLLEQRLYESIFETRQEHLEWSTFWANLPDGQYSVEFHASDISGNIESCSVPFIKDTGGPEISVQTPLNISYHDPPQIEIEILDLDTVKESVKFTVSPNDYHLDYCESSSRYFFNQSSEDWGVWSAEWVEMLENSSISFSASDVHGNSTILYDYILRDDSGPDFKFITGNGMTFNSTPEIHLQVEDPNLDPTSIHLVCNDTTYDVEHVSGEYYVLNHSSDDWNTWDTYFNNSEDGLIFVYGYSNDTFGVESPEALIRIYKDTTIPEVLWCESRNIWSEPPDFLINVSDNIGVFSISYRLNGSEWYCTSEEPEDSMISIAINDTLWEALSDGSIEMDIRVTDYGGNHIDYPKSIVKDTEFQVEISHIEDVYYETCPTVSVICDEEVLVTCLYNGSVFQGNQSDALSQELWSMLGYEMHEIDLVIQDAAGNENRTILNLEKRDSTPALFVNSPINNTTYEEPFEISLNVTGEELDTIWYEIEGVEGIFIIAQNGTIPDSIWKKIPRNANVTFNFYANSSHGMITNTSITFYKLYIRPAPLELFDLTSPLGIFFLSSSLVVFGVAFFVIRKRRKNS